MEAALQISAETGCNLESAITLKSFGSSRISWIAFTADNPNRDPYGTWCNR